MDLDFSNPVIWMPILVGLVIGWVIRLSRRLPGKELNAKFVKVGNFSNLSLTDFVQVVGSYRSITNYPDGTKLIEWSAAGYLMAIIFSKDDKFVRIHREIVN